MAERRVNLSSIRCPKMGNPRRDEKPAAYAREAREFLRTRLIGRSVIICTCFFHDDIISLHDYAKMIHVCQVKVSMEYSRKVSMADGSYTTGVPGSADSRTMDFGSVFLLSASKADGEDSTPAPPVNGQSEGINVAELVVSRGFGTVIRHRDFEERSNFYDALLAAESRATSGKKGIHSAKDSPVMHITDLTTVRGTTHFFLVHNCCIDVLLNKIIYVRRQLKRPRTSCHFYNEVEGFLLL